MRSFVPMIWFATLLVSPLLVAQQPGSSVVQVEATKKFRSYLDQDWQQWMHEYPEIATSSGYPGQNARWTDESPGGIASRTEHLRNSLAALKSIDRGALPPPEQINYDLYLDLLQVAEEGLQYGDAPNPFRGVVPMNLWMPLNQMNNVGTEAAQTLEDTPHRTMAEYETLLQRFAALPELADQHLALLKAGLAKGYTPPKIAMRDVPKQIADLIPDDPLKSPLLRPFTEFPASIPAADQSMLIEQAKKTYQSVVPAFRHLLEYLTTVYIPACRESIAATSLANGAAAYAFHVRWQTTTDLTPQQIHEIGLAEVKRIHTKMEAVIASTSFRGSFHDFIEFLRNDPQFYFDKKEDLVDRYKVIAKSIDPGLSSLFGKLPRNPYGVIPIPDFKAPSQTTAYYQPGAPSVGRPGYFCVNTYNLKARPKWEMEALSLHEAVPGHHLQIALTQEMEGVPEFRKHSAYSAFVEGWAHYGESLGSELGLYRDPYSQFGQLSYQMWRAVRLVVDTGMHSMGWTRQQAIDYFRENTGKTDQDTTVEIDRYIVWPGQALAYKLGQLKISELRGEAEKALGAKFDVRRFHDAVLENGALPLNILELRLRKWTAEQARKN